MAVSKNIVTDYGADNTGTVNAADKFYTALRADILGLDCDLTVPAGSYKFNFASGYMGGGAGTTFNLLGTGATLFQDTGGLVTFESAHMASKGLDDVDGASARIQSVSAGATSVTLTSESATAGYISRASGVTWMMVTGYDLQGTFRSSFGFPPNFHFIEFVAITSVVGNTINFTGHPLQNSYSDQWPELNRDGVDGGGPATVYFLHNDWNHVTDVTGVTLNNADSIKGCGRDFTLRNGAFSGGLPVYPSVNKNWSVINTDFTGAGEMEFDKLVENVVIDGGTVYRIYNQSSSVANCTIQNATINNGLNGTAKRTTVQNCTIANGINIGPTSYGRGETFTCTDSTVSSGSITGGWTETGGDGDPGVQGFATMSGGVITIPKSMGSTGTRAFVPDPLGRNVCFWVGNGNVLGGFQVLNVTSDPWPAVDNQSSTTNVTMTNGSKNLAVSGSIFSSGDVGKVIIVNGARSGGNPLRTFIKTFIDAQHVVLYDACSNALTASSQTVQWGTSNIYVQTNQSGGLPDQSLYNSDGRLFIRVPPARTVYFENVTGTADVVDLSQAAARNRPLNSYSKRTWDGTTFGATSPDIAMYGNIVSIKINVITPYTGVQSTLNVGFQQADLCAVIVGGVATTLPIRVNLKIAGERVITVGSTTGTQSGDSGLTVSAPTWMARYYGACISANITGESASVYPSFTIEVITDQGFSNSSNQAARVRLRVR